MVLLSVPVVFEHHTISSNNMHRKNTGLHPRLHWSPPTNVDNLFELKIFSQEKQWTKEYFSAPLNAQKKGSDLIPCQTSHITFSDNCWRVMLFPAAKASPMSQSTILRPANLNGTYSVVFWKFGNFLIHGKSRWETATMSALSAT